MTMGQMNKQSALWWSESHGDYPGWTFIVSFSARLKWLVGKTMLRVVWKANLPIATGLLTTNCSHNNQSSCHINEVVVITTISRAKSTSELPLTNATIPCRLHAHPPDYPVGTSQSQGWGSRGHLGRTWKSSGPPHPCTGKQLTESGPTTRHGPNLHHSAKSVPETCG